MINPRLIRHYLGLFAILALGTVLRFANLDLKPLWMDEVITALFSLGKGYHDLPLDVVLPAEKLQDIFTYQPGQSCFQIAQNLIDQSTHPPLFFCWMYSWLGWMRGENWIVKLRSLPAMLGVLAIAAIYGVNRLAFSKTSGLVAATLMAVSPFAVYLSQEARHYTLPMLLITLSLLELIQIQKDIGMEQQPKYTTWFLWIIINIIGFYVHYFFMFAFCAEALTLFIYLYLFSKNLNNCRKIWRLLTLSITAVILSFLPWLPIIFQEYNRPETNWIEPPNLLAPFYQTLMNLILMSIAFPVEKQPYHIAILSGLLMLVFAIWLGWKVCKGLKHLGSNAATYLATFTLFSFVTGVLLEFLAIAYFLRKDITAVPRYAFVYYPGICALIAASLTEIKSSKLQFSIFTVFLVGLVSCFFVVYNLAFLKPFAPEQVAQTMNQEPSTPIMLVVGYGNYQDVALGLSFALALEKLRNGKEISTNVAFLKKSPDFQSVWNKLSQLSELTSSQFNLWVVAPGIKRRDYPQQVVVSQRNHCIIDSKQHYRIGVPYQLYRCKSLL
jgi:uncharacterized membrane protein